MQTLSAFASKQLAVGRHLQQLHPYPDGTSEMCHPKLSTTGIERLLFKNSHTTS